MNNLLNLKIRYTQTTPIDDNVNVVPMDDFCDYV